MTTFRFRYSKILAMLAIISLVSCSKENEDADVDALKTEVEDLRARLDAGEDDGADDIVSKSWDEDPEAEVASKADMFPLFDNEGFRAALADQLESDQTRREIDSLKRQVDLDRLNREFERQDDERKTRRKELEHSLGLDHSK
jgi:polyhydroxyalkanoate synthesis regulator phasin